MNVNTVLLTLYVLIWPVLVAGTLTVIVRAFLTEWLAARREGRSII
ncbi:putative transporter small subunit [Leucobacter chromiireducens]|nr:putative transporter small subunit [Leucobacter chromiireducens]